MPSVVFWKLPLLALVNGSLCYLPLFSFYAYNAIFNIPSGHHFCDEKPGFNSYVSPSPPTCARRALTPLPCLCDYKPSCRPISGHNFYSCDLLFSPKPRSNIILPFLKQLSFSFIIFNKSHPKHHASLLTKAYFFYPVNFVFILRKGLKGA